METDTHISSAPPTRDFVRPISMIECETCQSPGFSYLAYAEAEALLCDGSVSRYCRVCNKKTMWKQFGITPKHSTLNVA